jgi:Leucine-rich repeat (LRR) protein
MLPRKYIKMADGSTKIITNPTEIVLTIWNETKYNAEKLLQNCNALTNIQRLSLCCLSFKTKRSMAPLCKLTELKELCLINCTVKILPDLTLLKNLKTIRLSSFHNTKIFDIIFTLKTLEELDLNICSFQVYPLIKGIHLKRLIVRDINANPPADKETRIKEICSLTNLEELFLIQIKNSDCPVVSKTLILPCEIHQMDKLKRLHIENSQLTDESIINICQLKNLQELVIDEFTRDNMPDEISMLPQSVTLKVLTTKELDSIRPSNLYS